jgi:uncharacterized protein (DUF1697 family)
METYVGLLRAVNVGGTGKLPMADLRSMCVEVGFSGVETYIASGNVVFTYSGGAALAKTKLESRLRDYAGKPVGVTLRTAQELANTLEANPFRTEEPNKTYVVFFDAPVPRNALDAITGRVDEELHLGQWEIYICYPKGMGRSKLKIPAAKKGTARNLNTVCALVEMSSRRP